MMFIKTESRRITMLEQKLVKKDDKVLYKITGILDDCIELSIVDRPGRNIIVDKVELYDLFEYTKDIDPWATNQYQ